jgi:thymidylate synthase ThyX
MISAKIIADSRNEFGNRLTTFVLTFPRIVLAEFNTHRMISKNSASSRAIPFKKMLQMVQENPFIPIKWQKDHLGMQGNEYFEGEQTGLKLLWLESRDEAIKKALQLNYIGVTKQICNRLLEPFMWHTVIATGSEWENFFTLRANDQAEIHIQDLAYKMLEVYNASDPKQLKAGEWHIPFGEQFDNERLFELFLTESDEDLENEEKGIEELKVKIATARCARVSYLNFEGKDDYEADLKLYDRLAASGHYSPFEHCAKAMSSEEFEKHFVQIIPAKKGVLTSMEMGWCGNFKGFIQLRKTLYGENKSDNRVKKLTHA